MDLAPHTAPAELNGPPATYLAAAGAPAGGEGYQSRLLMDLNDGNFDQEGNADGEDNLQGLTDEFVAMGMGGDKRPKPSGINNKDDNEGKLFVGGLSWETSKERLIEYFTAYGQVKECIIMRDPQTQRSRGFGFITFTDPQACLDVIQACPHTLDNRQIDPKPAVPHGTRQRPLQKQRQYKTKKIFVGGLAADSNQESLTAFFSEYGTVENVILMFDRETKRPRGFGFVTFSSEEPVVKLCKMHFVELAGKMVEVKMAQPKASVTSRRGNRSDFAQAASGYQYPGYGVAQQFTTTYDSQQSFGQGYGGQGYPFQSYPTQQGFVRGPQGFVSGYGNQGSPQGFMYFPNQGQQAAQDGTSRPSGQQFDYEKGGDLPSSMFAGGGQSMPPYGPGNNFQYQGGFMQQPPSGATGGDAPFLPSADGSKPSTSDENGPTDSVGFGTGLNGVSFETAESLVGSLSGDPI